MNALLKRDPDDETGKITDSGINLELLHAIYDNLDDLVRRRRRRTCFSISLPSSCEHAFSCG
jgi:hypothetical protein